MQRERREDTLIPSFAKGPWNIVKLGRWAGVIVLLSAPVLAVWETVYFHPLEANSTTGLYYIFPYLSAVIYRGVWGVVIILLAELLDRMTNHDDEQEE